MQAENMPRQIHPVSQCRCRRGAGFHRPAFLLPLPAALLAQRFCENMLAVGRDIDPHPARPRRQVDPVHFKPRIDDMQIEADGMHRLDRRPAPDCLRVALDQLLQRERRPLATQQPHRHREKDETSAHR
ncbi:MAG: hypothetical protein M3429_06230 [Verrucomicrobiota bacterium]|nr:hypothetical protein [Chthoniobacterales bacterium]MDQ3546099.1 hypothetical protein [Verrucomicrobiota bacterium]